MTLTPIRVRGKKNSEAAAQKRKLPSQNEPETSLVKRVRQAPAQKSLLERQLPLEILERIFYFSENIEFPLCSPLLGRMLSGRATLIGTVLVAFAKTWQIGFGIYDGPGHDMDEELGVEPLGSINRDFQTEILNCRWATVDILLDAQQVFVRRFAKKRRFPHDPELLGENRDRSHEGDREGVGANGDGRSHHFDAHACFAYDFDNMRRNWEEEKHASPATLLRQPSKWCSFTAVYPWTKIPEKLVTGPWTDEMVRRLFWLRRGGARIDEDWHTWEVKLQGLYNAVADCPPSELNPQLIRYLCLMGDFFTSSEPCLRPRPSRPHVHNLAARTWPYDKLEEARYKIICRHGSGDSTMGEVLSLLRHMDIIVNLRSPNDDRLFCLECHESATVS